MKLSDAGARAIARFECLRTKLYDDLDGRTIERAADAKGRATIGVGHMLSKAEIASKMYDGINLSRSQCMTLFAHDIEPRAVAVDAMLRGVPVTQHQFDALVSFAFNVGCGALAKSALLSHVFDGHTAEAAEQFLAWTKWRQSPSAPLETSKGLMVRRQAERAMFLAPDDATDAELSDMLARAMLSQFDLGQLVDPLDRDRDTESDIRT